MKMKKLLSIYAVLALIISCTQENRPDNDDGSVDIIHVTGITLTPSPAKVKVGETVVLEALVTPEDASNKKVNWTTSDPSVATVEDGTVTGVKIGNATIVATTEDSGKTAVCQVSVENNLPPSVTLDAEYVSAVSALLGGEANLNATLSAETKLGIQLSDSVEGLLSADTELESKSVQPKEGGQYAYVYSVKIPGLEPDTKYYYRSYVTEKGQNSYGETKEFTTKELSSLIEALDASDVKASSATIRGQVDLSEVEQVYEADVIEYGFLWGDAEDKLDSSVKGGPIAEKLFSASLTGLSHKTQYWFNAYVKLDGKSYESPVKTFKTELIPVAGVSLDRVEHTFKTIGATLDLHATVLPEEATDKEISWASDKDDVATVDENGKVTAVGNGIASITVTTKDQDKTAICVITVAQAVTGITLTPSSVILKEGENIELTPSVTPANAANKTVVWSSNKEEIATVADGIVTGVKAGSAIITATTEDGGLAANCNVTVESKLAPSVTVGTDHLSAISVILMGKANLGNTVASDLKIGFQYSKSAGILPANSTTVNAMDADADYNYTTSITGLEPATTYYFRSFVRQNNVDVYGETKSFTTKNVDSMLETMEATDIEATGAVLNAKLDLTDVLYSSEVHGFYWGTSENSQNTKINGGTILNNTYKASISNLSHKTKYWYKAYVKLDSHTFYGEVKAFTTDVVLVESVSLNKTEYTFNTIGNTLALKATVLPAEATDKSIEWSSDKESVATVDQNGLVRAVGNGKATITAKAKDGSGVKATCNVVVKQYVTSISLDKTSLSLLTGDEVTLSVTSVQPDNANDKTYSWSSSDSAIASVDNSGKVTAKAKGNVSIKVTANDGSGVFASCSVVVKNPCPSGAVDLGLSVYWGTTNIGASKPEDYGDYYAWGETATKTVYSSSTYKFGTSSDGPFSKYNTNSSYGEVDNKTVLDPEDDVAHVKLGGKWRIPTDAECRELWTQCTWGWTTQNGVGGYKFTSKTNGNSIFLPAAGSRDPNLSSVGFLGSYWSSSLRTESPGWAWYVYFQPSYVAGSSYVPEEHAPLLRAIGPSRHRIKVGSGVSQPDSSLPRADRIKP